MSLNEEFARLIRARLAETGLTLEWVAREVGVDRPQLVHMLLGERDFPFDLAVDVGRAVGVEFTLGNGDGAAGVAV